jgi:hypothetical protein
MKNLIACSLAAAFAGSAVASPILVTSNADRGAGSLRAAITEASRSTAPQEIVVATDGDIELSQTLSYTGRAPLTLTGQSQTLKIDANATLLEATEGADVSVSSLRFQGPAGYNIENRGDTDGQTAGKGIFVDVRDDQSGTVRLDLTDVVVTGFANHGVHVSDCNLADECGGGGGGAGEGSAASIAVTLNNVDINLVGQGRFDADGLRIDERSMGDIHVNLLNSSFTRVGADGVEFDEGQAGDVVVLVDNSAFNNNGDYCHPDKLAQFMPAVDEAEFEDGQQRESDIPGKITGTPDDRCFEREVDTYDSGFVEAYEFGIDVDDGFDVDEAGPGHLRAVVRNSVIRGNFDEGLDFDEEGPGSIVLSLSGNRASGNTDDGFKNSEEGPGDVLASMISTESTDNGGKGAVFEEENAGDVSLTVYDAQTSNNDDSDNTGLEVVQDDAGQGRARVQSSTIADGIDASGVMVR